MSVDSFVTAASDITNLNGDGFITGTKGRFKVIHIEETDEGIQLNLTSVLLYAILVSSISETQPQQKYDLFSESIPQQSLSIPPPVNSEDNESPVETELVVEKGIGFLKNLYDYQGGTFIPTVDNLSTSPSSSSNAQLNTLFGVYLPCVQNIIGVIVFIRLYWVIGVSGILEGMIIIGLCCLCTFLTAISLAASKKMNVKRMIIVF
jgi:hypothetical protein